MELPRIDRVPKTGMTTNKWAWVRLKQVGVAHEETKDGKRTQQLGVIDERRDN